MPGAFPFLETAYEAWVWLYASPAGTDEGEGVHKCHASLTDKVRDDDGCWAGDALLTVYQNVLATLKRGIDTFDSALEVRLEVVRLDIENVHAVALVSFLLERRKPGRVQHLDKHADMVLA
jgi:hypothetical protein